MIYDASDRRAIERLINFTCQIIHDSGGELSALRKQLVELLRDAERYRTLRAHGMMLPRLNTAGAYVTFNIGHDWIQEFEKWAFDAAVDALPRNEGDAK